MHFSLLAAYDSSEFTLGGGYRHRLKLRLLFLLDGFHGLVGGHFDRGSRYRLVIFYTFFADGFVLQVSHPLFADWTLQGRAKLGLHSFVQRKACCNVLGLSVVVLGAIKA